MGQKLKTCHMIALSHEPPELITCTILIPEGQGEHPLSELVLKKSSLVFGGVITYYNYFKTPAEITDLVKTLYSRISEALPP